MMCYSVLDPHRDEEDNYGCYQIAHLKLTRTESIWDIQSVSGKDIQSASVVEQRGYEKVFRKNVRIG